MEAAVIALDTNIVTEMMRGTFTDLGEDYYIPFVVEAEILAGVKAGNDPAKYVALTEALLGSKSFIRSQGLGRETLESYTTLSAQLQMAGNKVSPNDLWIAAECISLDLPLLTRDADFRRVTSLRLI